VSKKPHSKTTTVISEPEMLNNYENFSNIERMVPQIAQAKGRGLPIIKPSYVFDCLKVGFPIDLSSEKAKEMYMVWEQKPEEIKKEKSKKKEILKSLFKAV